MDNIRTIITPNGYSVFIKNDLTYGDYEDLQAMMSQNIKLDDSGKPVSIDFTAIKEANAKAMSLLVVGIKKDDIEYTGTIRDLPVKDGKAIQNEIDKIMKDASDTTETGEKKGI